MAPHLEARFFWRLKFDNKSELFTMMDRTLGLWDGGKDSSSRVK
jgi:hypothetical protein